MQALILNDDREAQTGITMALLKRGFHVINAESISVAMAYVGLGAIDLVVLNERIDGKLSHNVALSAEYHNPQVTTLLMTPRTDGDVDELYDLLPSLYCLLGTEISPDLVAQLALSAVVGKARAMSPRHQKTLILDMPDTEMSMTFRSARIGTGHLPDHVAGSITVKGHTSSDDRWPESEIDGWIFTPAAQIIEPLSAGAAA